MSDALELLGSLNPVPEPRGNPGPMPSSDAHAGFRGDEREQEGRSQQRVASTAGARLRFDEGEAADGGDVRESGDPAASGRGRRRSMLAVASLVAAAAGVVGIVAITGRDATRIDRTTALDDSAEPAGGKGDWAPIAPLPSAERDDPVIAWDGSSVVVWGGVSSDGTDGVGTVRWDPATDRWTDVDDQVGKVAAGSVRVDDVLAVFGGVQCDDGAAIDCLDPGPTLSFVPDDGVTLAPAPIGARTVPRLLWDASADEIVVWGGLSIEDGTPLSDGAVYDIGADRWTAIPPQPQEVDPLGPAGWWEGTLTVAASNSDGAVEWVTWSPDDGWSSIVAPSATTPDFGASTQVGSSLVASMRLPDTARPAPFTALVLDLDTREFAVVQSHIDDPRIARSMATASDGRVWWLLESEGDTDLVVGYDVERAIWTSVAAPPGLGDGAAFVATDRDLVLLEASSTGQGWRLPMTSLRWGSPSADPEPTPTTGPLADTETGDDQAVREDVFEFLVTSEAAQFTAEDRERFLAHHRSIAACMAAKGFLYEVPAAPEPFEWSREEAAYRGLDRSEYVARYGFGISDPDGPDGGAGGAGESPSSGARSRAYRAALEGGRGQKGCRSAAPLAGVPSDPRAGSLRAEWHEIRAALADEVAGSAENKAWRRCMDGEGFDFQNRSEMLEVVTNSILVHVGMMSGADTPLIELAGGPEEMLQFEIDVATKDLGCHLSSGLDALEERLRDEAKQRFIADHAALLDELARAEPGD